MHRATPLNTSFRAYSSGGARTMISGADDGKMMQEMAGNFMKGETRDKVESPQNYGFSSVVRAATKDAQGMIKEAAEGFVSFMGGNRSFPVCAIMDDRRHRPMGLKEGENAQYDDLGQMTLLRRAGLFLLSLDGPDDSQKQSGGGQGGSGGSSGQQQTVKRFVSIRHVEKKKQQRKGGSVSSADGSSSSSGSGGIGSARDTSGGSGSGQSGGQSQQDFKHEGESVNHEIRVSKGRIEFRSGDSVVGYYDGQSKTWVFIGKIKLGTESASHPVYGVNQGVGMTTDPNGSDAVLVNAPKPGPPTSLDTKP
jgi:hypothetical protein